MTGWNRYYIEDGDGGVTAVDSVVAWARWFEGSGEVRRVAWTDVGESSVSTVFLGLDHGMGEGRPVLYETLVFGGVLDGEMERYSTRGEAVAGHEVMVGRVRQAEAGEGSDG